MPTSDRGAKFFFGVECYFNRCKERVAGMQRSILNASASTEKYSPGQGLSWAWPKNRIRSPLSYIPLLQNDYGKEGNPWKV